jgi:hypothetical protein
MIGQTYHGPVRDAAHAGWLQARFEGHSHDDMFGDTLDASVTAYCLRELSFHLGFDQVEGVGDKLSDALFDAFSEDGVSIDSHDAATEWLERYYPKPADWLDALKTEAERVTKRKQRDAAKRAVWQFVWGMMA